MSWVIYGATGTTGALIAEAAVRRGHRPVLAGRSAERLAPLADRLGLRWQAVDLEDGAGLARLAGSAGLVLLAASPFTQSSPRVVRACLEAGAHYLDVANEPGIFEAVYALDEQARSRGLTLLPGAGFGVTATDTLARHVADQLPGATRLEITYALYTAGSGPGTRLNALSLLTSGGLVRRSGQLVSARLGAGARRVTTPAGTTMTAVPVPMGDLSAAYRTTGIGDITVETTTDGPPGLVRAVMPVAAAVAGSRLVSRLAARPTARADVDPVRQTFVRARAEDAEGGSVESWLETGEGYLFTAEAAVRAVEAVQAGSSAAGAHTPGALLGPDFALDIPGTRRHDTVVRIG